MAPLAPFVALSVALFGLAQAASVARPLSITATGNSPTRPNGYIVALKPSSVARRSLRALHSNILQSFTDAQVHYEWPVLNAFAGTFTDAALQALRTSDDVLSIEHDTIGDLDELVTQEDAPWGLQRISHVTKLARTDDTARNFTYTYDTSAGEGVDIYVIDTGVMINHTDFGGRARWGTTFGGYKDEDGYGHGTHVAGTAAGTRWGVAKAANIVAVRTVGDNGNGLVSDTIAAVNWAIEQVTTVTNAPSVITMSLRFDPSDVLDAAVTAAIDAGIHVTVSAGNAARDASSQSPARAPAVTCVGATGINDTIAYFSNVGPLVDIFSPGLNVVSDYPFSTDLTTVMSGTSMSTPHVAGLTAYLVALEGNKSPAEVLARIKELGPDNLISGIPADTVNDLLNNGDGLD
ncbi:serine protease [Exidia glandulosa HHB12029]|uniref:Serine protease n=1 Tax=Exidia glandulosa HHB12029 TaxID=1314781 RepID=A0A165KXM8_EXIGL|nr:serine protease [Exidia glandulosa HHB12029]